MRAVLPAALAGIAAAIGVGLPVPRQVLPKRAAAAASWRRLPAVLPLVAGAVALPVLGPVAAALAVVLALVVRRSLALRAARLARTEERAGAAEALAVLAAELRAGRAPEDALERCAHVAAGPTRQALAGAAAAARVGGEPAEVLRRCADGVAVPELLRGLAACWQVCQGTGSSLAAAVDRLEEALHDEAVRRDAVEAELAGPRATATLLASLPALGIVLAAVLGARPLHVLLHTPIGAACLVAGVALDLAGVWWTGRIVAGAGGVR